MEENKLYASLKYKLENLGRNHGTSKAVQIFYNSIV